MTNQTWTLDDIRHDLAVEMVSLRRNDRHWKRINGNKHDALFYRTVIQYVSELGHNLYERPERKHRR